MTAGKVAKQDIACIKYHEINLCGLQQTFWGKMCLKKCYKSLTHPAAAAQFSLVGTFFHTKAFCATKALPGIQPIDAYSTCSSQSFMLQKCPWGRSKYAICFLQGYQLYGKCPCVLILAARAAGTGLKVCYARMPWSAKSCRVMKGCKRLQLEKMEKRKVSQMHPVLPRHRLCSSRAYKKL